MRDLVLSGKHQIKLSEYDRLSGVLVSGYPSSGIATYVCGLISQDIKSHTATILIDPYGDMAQKLKKEATKKEKSEIIHIRLGELKNESSLNIFDTNYTSSDQIADTVVSLFFDLYDPNHTGIIGPRFEQAIRMAVSAVLLDNEPNFEKLIRIFTDKNYLQTLVSKIKDQNTKSYWLGVIGKADESVKSEMIDYIISRILPLVSDHKISASINGGKTFDLIKALDSGKTVIFDLGAVTYDSRAYSVLGSVALHIVEQAILAKNKKTTVALYVDEVQMLSLSRLSKMAMFAKRYGIATTYITSRAAELGSLEYECSRFGTKVSFRQMPYDAEIMQRLFVTSSYHSVRLTTLKRFHVYLQTLRNSEIQPPVVIEA